MTDSTKRIIEHHFQAFRANDLEAVLSDYSEQSVIFTPDADYYGIAQIRTLFVTAFTHYPKEGTTLIIDKLVTNGHLAYVVWHGETPAFTVPFSTATYVIHDGKILKHTIGRITVPK